MKLTKTLSIVLGSTALATAVNAASLTPSAGYQVGDALSSSTLSAYDVYDDSGAKAYGWDATSGTLRQYDVATGSVMNDFGTAPGGYVAGGAFISFVRYSTDGSVWVGFTTGDFSDDRIYQITNLDTTPTWNLVTTLAGNYDLTFSSTGDAFVSSNLGGFGNPNKLFYLDASNGFAAIEFAETGGYSSDLIFDASGNLVYGTNGLTTNQLVSFSSADVASFLADTGSWTALGLGDADVLSNLSASASGLYADEFGNVYVSITDYWSFGSVLQWSGVFGEDDNTINIAGVSGNSTGELDGLGDLSDGGSLYQSIGYLQPGLDVISAVPEPSQYAMAAGILCLGLAYFRRRR